MMRAQNLAAIHDRIDEEHFEIKMQLQAIQALQRTVADLGRAVRALEATVMNLEDEAREKEQVTSTRPPRLRKI